MKKRYIVFLGFFLMFFWSSMNARRKIVVRKKHDENHILATLKESRESKVQAHEHLHPVPFSWKEAMRREFDTDVSFLQMIITEGEAQEEERNEFERLVSDQKNWFDTKITTTTFYFDSHYRAAMKKKESVSHLVQLQRKAEHVLETHVPRHTLSLRVFQKARLLLLYELTAYIRLEKFLSHTVSSDKKIDEIVRRVVQDLALTKKEAMHEEKQEKLPEKIIIKEEVVVEPEKEIEEESFFKDDDFEELKPEEKPIPLEEVVEEIVEKKKEQMFSEEKMLLQQLEKRIADLEKALRSQNLSDAFEETKKETMHTRLALEKLSEKIEAIPQKQSLIVVQQGAKDQAVTAQEEEKKQMLSEKIEASKEKEQDLTSQEKLSEAKNEIDELKTTIMNQQQETIASQQSIFSALKELDTARKRASHEAEEKSLHAMKLTVAQHKVNEENQYYEAKIYEQKEELARVKAEAKLIQDMFMQSLEDEDGENIVDLEKDKEEEILELQKQEKMKEEISHMYRELKNQIHTVQEENEKQDRMISKEKERLAALIGELEQDFDVEQAELEEFEAQDYEPDEIEPDENEEDFKEQASRKVFQKELARISSMSPEEMQAEMQAAEEFEASMSEEDKAAMAKVFEENQDEFIKAFQDEMALLAEQFDNEFGDE